MNIYKKVKCETERICMKLTYSPNYLLENIWIGYFDNGLSNFEKDSEILTE